MTELYNLQNAMNGLTNIIKTYAKHTNSEVKTTDDAVSFHLKSLPSPVETMWFKELMINISKAHNVRMMYTKEYIDHNNIKVTFIIKNPKNSGD